MVSAETTKIDCPLCDCTRCHGPLDAVCWLKISQRSCLTNILQGLHRCHVTRTPKYRSATWYRPKRRKLTVHYVTAHDATVHSMPSAGSKFHSDHVSRISCKVYIAVT